MDTLPKHVLANTISFFARRDTRAADLMCRASRRIRDIFPAATDHANASTTETGSTLTRDQFGLLHSVCDRPAYITVDGALWFRHGQRHRDNDQPAFVCVTGTREWWFYGRIHRAQRDISGQTLPAIISPKTREWWLHGQHHRDDRNPISGMTLPASIYADGTKMWYIHDQLHRDDRDPITGETLPARIAPHVREWYYRGQCHRNEKSHTGEDLPAVIHADGSKVWVQYGKYHRDKKDPITGEALPAVIDADGSRQWYINGQLHRDDDLPSIIRSGNMTWYKYDKKHRDGDLPAYIDKNGAMAWYINDQLHRDARSITGEPYPTVITSKKREWHQRGELYRDDGRSATIHISAPDETMEGW